MYKYISGIFVSRFYGEYRIQSWQVKCSLVVLWVLCPFVPPYVAATESGPKPKFGNFQNKLQPSIQTVSFTVQQDARNVV